MSLSQLYYTSCEQGLSGYAGYQFNAVTPGTPADTRSLVESLTGYEAPHSFAYTADREALAGCPVNLCYSPGPTTIVANVQYVGHDASGRRFGNYFAHALATTAPDADLRDVLPIELWRAPFWVGDQARSPDLPPFDAPLIPGPLSRSVTGRFIAARPHRERLPALLSAVGRACDGTGRPVLVVEDTADDVAQWFAAVCYLLPERFVRRLAFATYLSRPSRSRLHLRGTVSETNLDLGSDATENFCLFDFPGERFSPVPPHPLAELAARVDIPVAIGLWGWAQALASGQERSFDDWHPVSAAAAALGQIELGAGDVTAAASWLEQAGHLPASRQREIAWALHDCRAVSRSQLVLLRDVARRNGDQGLYEQSQYEVLEADMLAAMLGQPEASAPQPVSDVAVRDKVSARCQEAFQHGDSAAGALRLLDWAAAARLTLDPEVVTASTRRLIAPWLMTDVPGRPVARDARQRAHRIARAWPQFRAGLVGCLTDQGEPGQPAIGAAMSGLVGELLAEDDLAGHDALGELYLVCAARRKSDRAVEALVKIARRRGDRSVDVLLLELIWPSGGWTRREAVEILDKLGDRQRYGEGVSAWFCQATETELPPADLKLHLTLCRRLLSAPIAKSLSRAQIEQLRASVTIDATREASELRQLIPVIAAYGSSQSAAIRQLMRSRIPLALTTVQANPRELAETLLALDAGTFTAYLRQVDRMLAQWAPGTSGQLAALWLLGHAASDARAQRAGPLLDYAATHWHRKDLYKLSRLIASADADAGAEFDAGVAEARSGMPRRAVRSAVGIVTTFGRSRLADRGPDTARRGDGAKPAASGDGPDAAPARPDDAATGPGG